MVAVLAIGCTHSSPKSVAKAYLKAIQKKDAKKAADCFYYDKSQSKEDLELAHKTMENIAEKAIKGIDEEGGIESFKITNVEENGDKAVVKGTVKYGNGNEEEKNISTVKKDGKWYVDDSK